MTMVKKKDLELFLENTPEYSSPKEHLEQYITPPIIASELLWEAFMHNDIADKTILDMGCGTLRLGLGALMLDARRVIGIDIDCDVLNNVVKWIDRNKGYKHKILLICGDVIESQLNNIDTVIMNPPFGVKKHNRGLDVMFLKKALTIAKSVYSIHKDSPGLYRIVNELLGMVKGRIVYLKKTIYPIKMILPHHRRRVYWINVVLYGVKRE